MVLHKFGKRLAGAVVVCASLFYMTGCSHLRTQFTMAQEPEDGERARLRIVANMLVKAVPGKNCLDWNAPGAGTVFGGIVGSSGYRGRSLDMPAPPEDRSDFGEMYVRAGEPFAMQLLTTPESRFRCAISAYFVPEANQDYEARLDLNSRVCSISIINLTHPDQLVDFKRTTRCARPRTKKE